MDWMQYRLQLILDVSMASSRSDNCDNVVESTNVFGLDGLVSCYSCFSLCVIFDMYFVSSLSKS
jgi:hypothetical protein